MRYARSAATAKARTTTSAPAGAPVRADARPSGLDPKPSRASAKRIREAAVAAPSVAANALIVAPKLMKSANASPMYSDERSPSGDEDSLNRLAPAAVAP